MKKMCDCQLGITDEAVAAQYRRMLYGTPEERQPTPTGRAVQAALYKRDKRLAEARRGHTRPRSLTGSG